MANNTIQIKRSNTSSTPTTTLNPGELAYSYNSNNLFIGAQTGIGSTGVLIAGAKYQYLNNVATPGVIANTAAIVTDGNTFTNNTYTQGLWIGASSNTITPSLSAAYITSISSTGSASGLGATNVGTNNEIATTYAIVNYVNSKFAGGAVNTSAQYAFTNTISFSANVTFNSSVNGNTVIGFNSTDSSITEFAINANNFGEVVVWNANTGNNASGDFIVNDNNGPAPTNQNYIDLGINGSGFNQPTSWTINGPSDGYLYTGNTNLSIGTLGASYVNFFTGNTLISNERLRLAANGYFIFSNVTGVVANGSVGTTGQVLTSNGSGVYWATSTGGGSVNTAATYTFTAPEIFNANVTIAGNTSAELLIGTGAANLVITSSQITLQSNSTISATVNATNYSGTSNNASYLGGVLASGYQTVAGLTTAVAALTANNATYFNGYTWAAPNALGTTTPNSATFTTVNATSYAIGTAYTVNSTVMTFTGTTLTGTTTSASLQNLTLSGNLTVSGTMTTINTTNLNVNDNLILLADNNGNAPSDVIDIGFIGVANSGASNTYYGLARIAAQNTFTLFASANASESTATTIGAITTMPLQAYLTPYGVGGAFVVNSTSISITANSTVGVNITANSISLGSAIGVSSGGTGLNTVPTGALLTGNGTGTMTALGVGANGTVLQIINNLPAYSSLDGGSF